MREDYVENWNLLRKYKLIRSYRRSIQADLHLPDLHLFIQHWVSMTDSHRKISVNPLKVDLGPRGALWAPMGSRSKTPKIVYCFGVQRCLNSPFMAFMAGQKNPPLQIMFKMSGFIVKRQDIGVMQLKKGIYSVSE